MARRPHTIVRIITKRGPKGYKEYDESSYEWPTNRPIPCKGDQLYFLHYKIPLVVRKIVHRLETPKGVIPSIQIICSNHK